MTPKTGADAPRLGNARVGVGVGGDADFGGKASECRSGQGFGLSVGPVLGGGDVLREELTVADAFTQVVGADVDVLACVKGSGLFFFAPFFFLG